MKRLPISPHFAQVCVSIERYGLSLAYFLLAVTQAAGLVSMPLTNWRRWNEGALLLLFQLLIGTLLLTNKAVKKLPDHVGEVLIPLLGVACFVLFNAAPLAPAALRRDLLPASLGPVATLVAWLLSTTGYILALWGAAALGRSFSVMVSVRAMVTRGPYRYVRHPIYLAYLCLTLAVLLAGCTIFNATVALIVVLQLIYRARLEEVKLLEFSSDYATYQQKAGFLLPRFFNRPSGNGTLSAAVIPGWQAPMNEKP